MLSLGGYGNKEISIFTTCCTLFHVSFIDMEWNKITWEVGKWMCSSPVDSVPVQWDEDVCFVIPLLNVIPLLKHFSHGDVVAAGYTLASGLWI